MSMPVANIHQTNTFLSSTSSEQLLVCLLPSISTQIIKEIRLSPQQALNLIRDIENNIRIGTEIEGVLIYKTHMEFVLSIDLDVSQEEDQGQCCSSSLQAPILRWLRDATSTCYLRSPGSTAGFQILSASVQSFNTMPC